MEKSSFNPAHQEHSISGKIVAGLERLSEVFKMLLWEKAKVIGLSPIQIQLLIFIAFHKKELCNVSHFAKEFNVTKPTISDAIRVLVNKGLISKDFSTSDNRSYSLQLTPSGIKLVEETNDFANPLKQQLDKFDETELGSLFRVLSELIFKLNKTGILKVQRTCPGCRYYEKRGDIVFCNLLRKKLLSNEIRLDCPEFEDNVT